MPKSSDSNYFSFDSLSTDQFLKDYWQKKPLVIQQGFKNFSSPISAEELAGLACEDDVHSRIVIEKGGKYPWQLINGPMDDAVFSSLPETHWTLLVNDVEKHIPDLAFIVDAFRFIPEWRIDDLMISYAPEGGTVGPHLDQYDVFIVQAQGHRRWQVNTQAVSESNQLDNVNLKIQKDFSAEQEWLLAPGDVIYIPPGVSHYGVAADDCLSFSIGFRAPSHTEMLTSFVDFISHDLPKNKTFKDAYLECQQSSNEIKAATIDNVRNQLAEYLRLDTPVFRQWFGCFVSDTKIDLAYESEDNFPNYNKLKMKHNILYRNPASRFAFCIENNEASLFIDGSATIVSLAFAQSLCAQREIDLNAIKATNKEQDLIVSMYHAGQLILKV